jgi:hypothetical protein
MIDLKSFGIVTNIYDAWHGITRSTNFDERGTRQDRRCHTKKASRQNRDARNG